MPPIWSAQRCLNYHCSIPSHFIHPQSPNLPKLTYRLRAVHSDNWPELALQEVANQVEGVRVRQHLNPLRKELQVQLQVQDWSEKFADPERPLIVDVGCGPGRFLLALAQRFQNHNLLGLDIRERLIERANSWSDGLGLLSSAHFMTANATVSLGSMLSTYPGPLTLVTVQFPDPHFKRKHQKRRVIQPQIVQALIKLMPPGGRIFLQSDIKDAATSMFEEFTEHGSAALRPHGSAAFRPDCSGALLSENVLLGAATLGLTRGSSTSDLRAESHSGHDRPHSHEEQGSSGPEEFPQNDRLAQQEDASAGDDMSVTDQSYTVSSHAQQGWPPDIEWLQDNPLGVPTEREVHVYKHGGSVYRALLVRC